MVKFKHLGRTEPRRNQNYIHEEIKSRLNSANAFCRSVQNPLSSSLLPKIYKIITFLLSYGSENLFLIHRE